MHLYSLYTAIVSTCTAIVCHKYQIFVSHTATLSKQKCIDPVKSLETTNCVLNKPEMQISKSKCQCEVDEHARSSVKCPSNHCCTSWQIFEGMHGSD